MRFYVILNGKTSQQMDIYCELNKMKSIDYADK